MPEAEKENAWMTGITYIGKQLEEALATNGISAFEAKEGDVFDPHRHEAVSQEEKEGKSCKSSSARIYKRYASDSSAVIVHEHMMR